MFQKQSHYSKYFSEFFSEFCWAWHQNSQKYLLLKKKPCSLVAVRTPASRSQKRPCCLHRAPGAWNFFVWKKALLSTPGPKAPDTFLFGRRLGPDVRKSMLNNFFYRVEKSVPWCTDYAVQSNWREHFWSVSSLLVQFFPPPSSCCFLHLLCYAKPLKRRLFEDVRMIRMPFGDTLFHFFFEITFENVRMMGMPWLPLVGRVNRASVYLV